MIGQYNLWLVALSMLVAVAASYTALQLAERVATAKGRAATLWLAGGSLSMGIGIWSMHFIGMLAFSLPIPMSYDLATTGASLLIAVLISALALHVVSAPVVRFKRMLVSAGFLGAGISSMHYAGMSAITVTPGISYDPILFGASVGIAFGASFAALWILCSLIRRQRGKKVPMRLAAAAIMGAAISGMHFTGMAAAHFAEDAVCLTGSGVEPFALAVPIAAGTLVLLGITILGSLFEAHLHSKTELLNASLLSVNQELAYLATHDALTGLPNRALLGDRIEQAIADAERSGKSFALMFIDLDRFKVVNDSAGHQVGDELLRAVALRIQGCLRKTDTLARLGGDEFVVLLKNLGQPQEAAELAIRIAEHLEPAFQVPPHELHMTAALGISIYPDDGSTVGSLLTNADAAMYHAKQTGRDCFKFFAPTMNAFAHERLEVENGLRRALRNGELELHYQPKVDIDSDAVVSFEALIRWNHPTKGRVQPDTFIPIAEESGLIGPVGEWVLRTACSQARAWQDQGLTPMRVAVNLSAKQFRQTNLLEFVQRVLAETGLDACYLELELTESTVMTRPDESVKILESLSNLGVHIAIDDFGTGYSSLAYLKRLPLNHLKVDRSFVKDLTSNRDDASIVQAVISMAHSLRLKVIAEGVETAEQLELLRTLGCDQFQGFYRSPAVNAQEAAQFMARLPQRADTPVPAARSPQARQPQDS